MIKKILITAIITIFALMCCACGDAMTGEEIPLSKTVTAADDTIILNVPDSWEAKDSANTESLVLTLTDNASAYVQIYCYALDEEYDSLEAFLQEYQDYYHDDIISEVETLTIGTLPARRFEYLYEDYNEHFYEARFRGFVYLIKAPDWIIGIDAYHSITEPFSETDEVSTESERVLLSRIIESLRINDTADVPDNPEEQGAQAVPSPDMQEAPTPAEQQ